MCAWPLPSICSGICICCLFYSSRIATTLWILILILQVKKSHRALTSQLKQTPQVHAICVLYRLWHVKQTACIPCSELDVEDLMAVTHGDTDADYSPFPSKVFALLFILVHAIRPIELAHGCGNTVLNHIFMLHRVKPISSSFSSFARISTIQFLALMLWKNLCFLDSFDLRRYI